MDCGTKKRQPSGLHQKPNRNPAQHPQGVGRIRKAAEPPTAAHRLRFREEGQGNGADGIFAKKCRSKADFAPTWSKRSKSIFLSETNHDSLQVSNWGTDEKQVNTFLFKNHLQNRYIGEFLNSLNCFSDKEPKSFCASSCSSSRRKAHISRKLSDVLDIIACNSDFS